jgi:hypothetical protein
MSFLGSIIGDIAKGLASAVISWFQSFLDKLAAMKQGADAQAAKETATSLATETRIAQAEASGPKNIDQAIERAKEGTI